MKKHLKIGYLQQHNIADTKTNILRLAAGIKDLANPSPDRPPTFSELWLASVT